ncbi:MAG: phytanoyl-CoA dioxygenase family protein [Pseudomonadota bacterium]
MSLPPHVAQFREQGYAIVRAVIPPDEIAALADEADRIYAEAMVHHTSWRHGNLFYEILPDPEAGRIVLQAQWVSWVSERFEHLRRDPRLLAVLEPLVGRDLKQIANQIHWKPPGARFGSFRFHQDLRFRKPPEAYRDLRWAYVTTGLAIDPMGPDNGGLQVFPGSHRLDALDLSTEGPVMKGETSDNELRKVGLDPADAVAIELQPGDLLLWNVYTVHGSGPNRAGRDRRRFHINSYVKPDHCARGEWAFKDGQSCPLGSEPSLVRYGELAARPEPHYVENRWWE